MHQEDLKLINDDPWFWSDIADEELPVPFLVRCRGKKEPFGIVVARDRNELFWIIDEAANPYDCEVSVVVGGEAYFSGDGNTPTISNNLESRIGSNRAWRPVDDGSLFLKERAERLSKSKREVRNLERLLTDLGRKING